MSSTYVRDEFLKFEKQNLSEYACLSSQTKGRDKPYVPCEIRTEFQRDRDKILHCQSFRRLMNKTQVFLAPAGDHYRTRMTHTLEVTQIARIIARGLRLNEDLTEAAALGHDLGHTPFGHAGEYAMQKCFDPSFTHYKQSLRVVEELEKDGRGLNLTWEVRDGIVNHTGKNVAATLEGVIVKYADRIAYINHDIDDSIRAGVITEDDISLSIRKVLGFSKSERINTLVLSVIENSEDDIRLAPEVAEAMDELHTFMFANVYTNPYCKGEEGKADIMLKQLYHYFADNPVELPNAYEEICLREGADRAACDYISGMTDRFAVRKFEELFIPLSWS